MTRSRRPQLTAIVSHGAPSLLVRLLHHSTPAPIQGILMGMTFLLLSAKFCPGQVSHLIEQYGSREGLASEWARSMTQDRFGFIWTSHPAGLSRFDGYNFKIFRHDPNDSSRSALNFILGNLLLDHAGNLWIREHHQAIGKPLTLAKYDQSKDRFIRYDINIDSAFAFRIAFDQSDSVIWIGSRAGTLYSFDVITHQVRKYSNKHLKGSNPESLNIRGIADLGSSLFIASVSGLWKFDKTTGIFDRPDCLAADSSFLFNTNFHLARTDDMERYFWLTGSDRITVVNEKYRIVHRYSFPPGLLGSGFIAKTNGTFWFPGNGSVRIFDSTGQSMMEVSGEWNDIHQLFCDRDQNVWVATEKGLSKIRQAPLPAVEITQPSYSGIVVNGQTKDFLILSTSSTSGFRGKDVRENDLIIGELPGNAPGPIDFKPLLQNIPGDAIEYLYKGAKMLWIGNIANGELGEPAVVGLPIDQKSGAVLNKPEVMFYHGANDPNKVRLNSTVRIWEDMFGDVWINIRGGGMERINRKIQYGLPGSVDHFPELGKIAFSPHDGDSFWSLGPDKSQLVRIGRTPGDLIFSLTLPAKEFPDFVARTDSNIYLATISGLRAGKVVENGVVFEQRRLWEGEVKGLQEDKRGRLWMLIEDGLVCYDQKEQIGTTFRASDGVTHTGDPNLYRIYRTANGLMITADHNGLNFFDPMDFELDRSPVQPQLTRLFVNNSETGPQPTVNSLYTITQHISTLKELTLDYLHNNFLLEFAALEMKEPSRNLYRHLLEGYDKDWVETDYHNRTATYTNLPAGTYTFRVKASNHHGVWSNNERALKVIILPPPWRTGWAYIGYSLLAVGILLVARRNIVQRERLKANLQLEHVELEKAKEIDRAKSSFFTNISHEFRTPLTLIKGPVDTLLDRYKDDPEAVNRLKLVQRNSDLLLKLINQLLDLAKLESGTLKVEKKEGEVYSFVRAIASSFESMARQKGVTLKIEVPTGEAQAMFDKDKVETILINLINNAVKFTASGGSVSVIAESKTQEQNPKFQNPNSNLVLTVRDTGIGIPKDQHAKVFERFHQVTESHKEVGTGIGLALVKELVTLMEGTITIESEMGEGSVFTVIIPVEPATQAEAEPQTESIERTTVHRSPFTAHSSPEASTSLSLTNGEPKEEDSDKPQVLVVEDNGDLRAFIIDSLGTEFQFHEAENGKLGLKIATEQLPDMIISDVMMPEMDGMEMTRRIKEDIKTSHIPLILLTAKSGEDSKVEGLSKGADDYLTKPFNKQELLLKVRNGTARMMKLREKLKAEVLTSAPQVEVLSADEQFLLRVKETIIQQMSDEQLSVESLADDIGMSRVQLYRKVSALTGMAVNELIRKLRLQRAAQLLSQNWGPVSQVAYEVGFSNLSYFSKVFKEEFGSLPSEFVG